MQKPHYSQEISVANLETAFLHYCNLLQIEVVGSVDYNGLVKKISNCAEIHSMLDIEWALERDLITADGYCKKALQNPQRSEWLLECILAANYSDYRYNGGMDGTRLIKYLHSKHVPATKLSCDG